MKPAALRTALILATVVAGVGAAVVLLALGQPGTALWAVLGAWTVREMLGAVLPNRRTGPAASPPGLTITRTTRGPHDA